jgi:hypothetical protein
LSPCAIKDVADACALTEEYHTPLKSGAVEASTS